MPIQCILTRSDHDLFYGGELHHPQLAPQSGGGDSSEGGGLADPRSGGGGGGGGRGGAPHSYTCPFCAKPGFTESSLVDHVTSQHPDTTTEVVCPICASLPQASPTHLNHDYKRLCTINLSLHIFYLNLNYLYNWRRCIQTLPRQSSTDPDPVCHFDPLLMQINVSYGAFG